MSQPNVSEEYNWTHDTAEHEVGFEEWRKFAVIEGSGNRETSADRRIAAATASGHCVVSYMEQHRRPDGRPAEFHPQYPL